MAEYRKSYFKRSTGILIAAIPFLLAIASILAATTPSLLKFAWAILALCLSIGVTNFYLSFLRPRLWEKKRGSMEEYRFVSVIPVIGTLGSCVAIVAGFGSSMVAGLAILVLLIDSGGLPWIVGATWNDESLWGVELEGNGTRSADPNA